MATQRVFQAQALDRTGAATVVARVGMLKYQAALSLGGVVVDSKDGFLKLETGQANCTLYDTAGKAVAGVYIDRVGSISCYWHLPYK